MAHCAHILAPSALCAHILAPACAWAESTQPKQRSRSISSRLGNAIRAMKPGVRKERSYETRCYETTEKICVINVDALTEVEECVMSKPRAYSEDDISTETGSSRSSSTCSSRVSLSESVEEVSSFPGSIDEISMPSNLPRKSELDDLADVIANRARSQFSGRVYEDVRNAFLAADIDSDGKLNRTEAIAFCQHFDLSYEIASRFFTLLDRHETGFASWSLFMANYAPVFNKKTDFQLHAGAGRKWPAIQ